MMEDSAAPEAPPEPDQTESKSKGRPPQAARIEQLEEDVTGLKDGMETVQSSLDTITGLLLAAKDTQAEGAVPALPVEPEQVVVAEWGADGVFTYSSMHRNLSIMRDGGGKVVINNEVVNRPHVTIDFLEGQYTTTDPAIRDFIESHELFLKGNIVRGVTLRPAPLTVHTGPKTSMPQSAREVVRPAGALSATK